MAFVTFVPRHFILFFALLLMAVAVSSGPASSPASSPAGGPSAGGPSAGAPSAGSPSAGGPSAWGPSAGGPSGSMAMSPSTSSGDGSNDSDPEKSWGVDTPRYISRAVIRKDRVPCDTRGASYYNCGSADKAVNPYTRGCTKITKCPKSFK